LLAIGTIVLASSMTSCGSSAKTQANTIDSVKKCIGNVSRLKVMDRLASTIYATNFEWWDDTTGKIGQLHDYYGKTVVITFWGTWCDGCAADMDDLAALQKTYADSGVAFIGITLREPGSFNEILARVAQYCADHGIAYQQVIGNSEFAAAYGGIYQLPTTIMLTKEDKVLETLPGKQGKAKLEAEIRKTMAYEPPR
jgi:thiol-disulfide isomerase/thioredoxin